MRRTILAVVLALGAGVSHAGQFACRMVPASDTDCDPLIRDLVAHEFMERFPADRFEIVIVGQSTQYDDGTASGFATVGVAPKGKVVLAQTLSRMMFKLDQPASADVVEQEQQDTVRRAVADSMRRMGYRTVTSRMITDGDVYRTETVVTPVSRKCHQVKRGLGYNDGTGHEAWGLFEECD